MVDYKYSELFNTDSVNKQLEITSTDNLVHITNTELNQEQFELSESLCSESSLRFGCCEASLIKFKISNTFISLKNKWLIVKATLDKKNDAAFYFGKYKVYSDKPTADRRYREVEAYDAMYDIINTDVADWYNTILPNENSTVTMLQFRNSFMKHFGLEQAEAELINDSMIVHKTIQPEGISGKDVITAICEINGCFGHINRNGKFQYIYLKQNIQGLYPRNDLFPSDNLFPKDSDTQRISKSLYISCKYEDFITKGIEKLQIRQEENDIGVIYGEGDNCYIIEDNFLVYGKTSQELTNIAKNILSVIRGVTYRPFSAEVKGNPCLEVGDAVRLPTRYELIESYILKRTLKGIQALRDSYEANGEEYYAEKVNSVHKSIVALKGKTNTLTRTIEETKTEIKDVEQGLKSEITQTASQIRTEITNTKEGLESSITQTASQIESKVSANYETKQNAKETKESLESSITQTASQIEQRVSKTFNKYDTEGINITYFGYTDNVPYDASKNTFKYYLNQNNGRVFQSNGQIWEEWGFLLLTTERLSSEISQTDSKISTKVSKGDVSSEISQEAGEININADRIGIKSTYFVLTKDGHITATAGIVGGFTLTESSFGTYEDEISMHRFGDWALRIGDRTPERVDPGSPDADLSDQFQFCVGHEGRVYCEYLGCFGDMTVTNNLRCFGNIYKESSTYSTSDKDWKHSVEKLDTERTLKFVYSLTPVQFRYKKDEFSGAVHHGFIAQDVRKCMNNEDWALYEETTDKETGKLKRSLAYEELIADLVLTVQEQNRRIETLERRILNAESI